MRPSADGARRRDGGWLFTGGPMKFLVVTDDADRPALEEAMRHLRERQTRAVIDSTRAEIGADLDELLDAWMARG